MMKREVKMSWFLEVLSGVKIRNKIFFLTIAGILVFAVFASGAFILGQHEMTTLQKMYNDQVIPLKNLRKIQLHFKEIESGMTESIAGVNDSADSVNHLRRWVKEIDSLWQKTAPHLPEETFSAEKKKFSKGYKTFHDMLDTIENAYISIARENDNQAMKKVFIEWGKERPLVMESIDRMLDIHDDLIKESYQTRIGLIEKVRFVAVIGAVTMTAWFVVFTLLIIWSINKPIATVMEAAKRVSAGDFTATIDLKGTDEMGEMASVINSMIVKLNETFRIFTSEAESLFQHAEGLSGVSDLLVCGAEAERMQVNNVAASAEQMSNAINEVGKSTLEAEKTTEQSYESARDGSDIVEETKTSITELTESVSGASEAVESLGESSNKVGEIVSVIKDIADQTNLLALNAAIESARAGEQGRGFAVVADEVRKLAERTTQATGEVTDIIQKIQMETKSVISRLETGKMITESALSKAQQAGESHNSIVRSCGNVLTMVQSIASATEEQSVASRQVSESMNNIVGVINQTVMLSENIRSVSTELTSVASQLRKQVEGFRTETSEASTSASRPVASSMPDEVPA